MKVILNETVAKLGKAGQVVTVADGYARNFLFPRKLAVLAEKNQLKVLERRTARAAAKVEETKAAAEALKEKLDGKLIRIGGKVGREQGKLFGAITSQDIADEIKKALGVDLEKRAIALHNPLKRLGRHEILLDLHRDVDAHLSVVIFDPENDLGEGLETPATEEATEEEAVEA